MPVSFQYWIADGSFAGANSQPVEESSLPKGKAQVVLDEYPRDADGNSVPLPSLRWNDVMQVVEVCPKYARRQQRAVLFEMLAALDDKRDRALAEAFATGDKTWLLKHLDSASKVRDALAAIPEL